jgi:hypothetical protein
MAHMSHAYPDGCSIYFTFAGASPTDAEALETLRRHVARAPSPPRTGPAAPSRTTTAWVARSAGAMGLEWGAG